MYAGIWFSKSNFDFSRPLSQLVADLIKRGYDGIHEMHMIKYNQRAYRRPLKIPGSQEYRKDSTNIKEIKKEPELTLSERLERRMHGLFEMLENEDGSEEKSERIAIMLDSCNRKELWYLTIRFGPKKLGDYAIREL